MTDPLQTGRTALIFGGTGSLGNALVRRMLPMGLKVVIFSRDEAKQWRMRNEYREDARDGMLDFIIGDIRDYQAVERAIKRTHASVIIIASALKHVDVCEKFPDESVKTNIVGAQNVVDACGVVPEPLMSMLPSRLDVLGRFSDDSSVQVLYNAQALRKVVMVSSDKACSPVNVYGMCKSIAERIVTERAQRQSNTDYITVRYGNVLNSTGSIIPLFQHQAKEGDAFTITHEDMTRFIMTLDDSVDLIFDAIRGAKSGETWIPKLTAMRILDLAECFSARYDKPVKAVGIRPGEKLHEALINDAESLRQREEKGQSGKTRYVLGTIHDQVTNLVQTWYTSKDDLLEIDQLRSYLDELHLL